MPALRAVLIAELNELLEHVLLLLPEWPRCGLRRRLAAKLGWDGFPENSLRHSFATYHLARCKSAPLTAFQMGHSSPAMVQRVYAVPAARADEKAWWEI
jgi:integrase